MTTSLHRTLAALLFLGSAMAHAAPAATEEEAPGGEEIALPSVPSEADPRRAKPDAASGASSVTATGSLQPIGVEPGVNEIIPIATGHINRIVTPFADPRIATTTTANIETSQNVLYIAPADQRPITMFITAAGDERTSISLTLVPQEIPPREIELTLPKGFRPAQYAPPQDDRVESHQPHLDQLPDLLRTLAQGDLPPGYELTDDVPGSHPACDAPPDLEVNFEGGQYALGARLEVFIGVVENTGREVAEFQEVWCGAPEVVAVALWPAVVLQPGELTEIYVARRLVVPEERGRDRPSLLLTAQ